MRGGAQISSISPSSATTSPLLMTQGRRNASAGPSSGTRSSSTSGTAQKTHRQATESTAIPKVVSSYARYGATAPKNDSVGEKDKDCSMSVEHCPLCDEMVNSSDSSLKCDICDSLVHYHCSGLDFDVFTKLLDIVKVTGWSCLNCRGVSHTALQQISSLQTKMVLLSEQMADVLAKVDGLEARLHSCKCSNDTNNNKEAVTNVDNQSPAKVNHTDVAAEVHRTLADASRRRKNVVIVGLPESEGHSDELANNDRLAFRELCENNFSVVPVISKLGCRRLGNKTQSSSNGNKPRKLFVHLESEESVPTLMKEARRLRESDSTYIAENVFLNRDMSPAELKLAYERRVLR